MTYHQIAENIWVRQKEDTCAGGTKNFKPSVQWRQAVACYGISVEKVILGI